MECMRDIVKQQDGLDDGAFDAVGFVNGKFGEEETLGKKEGGLEELMQFCGKQVHALSEDISRRVVEASLQKDQSVKHIAETRKTINELILKVNGIGEKCVESEKMVVEITKDIKSYDIAKNNVSKYYDALKNFQLLNSLLEQLPLLISKKDYKPISQTIMRIESVFRDNFSKYKDAPKMRELTIKINANNKDVYSCIYLDFQEYAHSAAENLGNSLHDACVVLDYVDSDYKKSVLDWFTKSQLDRYMSAFVPQRDSILSENELDKRKLFWQDLKKIFREKWSHVFPAVWQVLAVVFLSFCATTKAHFASMLQQQIPNVKTLSAVLSKTIMFEVEQTAALNYKAPAQIARKSVPQLGANVSGLLPVDEDGTEVVQEEIQTQAQQIREKYSKRKIEIHEEVKKDFVSTLFSPKAKPAEKINFRGCISACFDAHMGAYSQMQLTNVLTMLEEAKLNEIWVPTVLNGDKTYAFATRFMRFIQDSKANTINLSSGSLFLDVVNVYKRLLGGYQDLLLNHLKSLESISELTDYHYISLVLVANTANYCALVLPNLQASIIKSIDEPLKGKVSFDNELQNFQNLVNKALIAIASKISSIMASIYSRFATEINWAIYAEPTYECSVYTQQVCDFVSSIVSKAAPQIDTPDYQGFFYNQIAQAVINRFINAIYDCKRISADGVQLMMVDTKSILTMLESLPLLGLQKPSDSNTLEALKLDASSDQERPKKAPPAYIRYVRNEIAKVDGMLKVIASNKQQIVPAYIKLFQKTPNVTELSRFIGLRVDVSASELKAFLNEFVLTQNPESKSVVPNVVTPAAANSGSPGIIRMFTTGFT